MGIFRRNVQGSITFAGYRIDPATMDLIDPHRQPQPLRRQSYEVLAVLLAKKNTIVTKDELIQAIWKDKVVSDDSVVQCVADIRRAIGDQQRTVLRTLPRKGYVLNTDEQTSSLAPLKVNHAVFAALVVALCSLIVLLYKDRWFPSTKESLSTNSYTDALSVEALGGKNFSNDEVVENGHSNASEQWSKPQMWIGEKNIRENENDTTFQIFKHGMSIDHFD